MCLTQLWSTESVDLKKALAPVVGEVSGDTCHIIISSETAGIS